METQSNQGKEKTTLETGKTRSAGEQERSTRGTGRDEQESGARLEVQASSRGQSGSQRGQSQSGQSGQSGQSRGQTGQRGSRAVGPFAFMQQMAEEMDRLFESFFYRGPAAAAARYSTSGIPSSTLWTPRVDVRERNGEFVVRADIPGISKEDLEAEVHSNLLTLRGRRRDEFDEEREGGYSRIERKLGEFVRTIPLPEGVDVESAHAKIKNGVLEVSFPLKDYQQGHHLQIEVESQEEGEESGARSRQEGRERETGSRSETTTRRESVREASH